LKNPSGDAIVLLARDKGLVVSCSAVVPRRIKVFGQEGVAAHGLWWMTRPDWRRRDLSRLLSTKVLEIAQKQGFLAGYGFANVQSLPSAVKYLGAHPVCPLPLMLRPVRPIRAVLELIRSKLFRVQETDSFLLPSPDWYKPNFNDRHTALFQEADALPPIAIVRDSAFLTWRYSLMPSSPYLQSDVFNNEEVEATVVARIASHSGVRLVFVMDWLWKSERRREGLQLMRKTMQLARYTGASGVVTLAMPGTIKRRLLRRLGFIAIRKVFSPRTITLVVRPHTDEPDFPRWCSPQNWYLTFGDGDLL
jgi:hypothetical protein